MEWRNPYPAAYEMTSTPASNCVRGRSLPQPDDDLVSSSSLFSPWPITQIAAQKRRHSLPSQFTAPSQCPQPHLEPPVYTATSPSTTVTTTATTTPKTTIWATASIQTTTDTSETANQAVTNTQRRSIAVQMRTVDDNALQSSKMARNASKRRENATTGSYSPHRSLQRPRRSSTPSNVSSSLHTHPFHGYETSAR